MSTGFKVLNRGLGAIDEDPHRKHVWRKKYGEDVKDTLERVASLVSSSIGISPDQISNGLNGKFKNIFLDLMYSGKFLPGGRILAALGDVEDRTLTPMNCFCLPVKSDSLEGIATLISECMRTYAQGGGCGIDISSLRPEGSLVNNAAARSSGAWSFMSLFDSATSIVGQKGRKGALLITMSVSHPDVARFISSKDGGSLTNMNISVKITKQFLDAVNGGDDWDLWYPEDIKGIPPEDKESWKEVGFISECYDFHDQDLFYIRSDNSYRRKVVYNSVNASKLWDEMCKHAHCSGDPGIMMWSNTVDDSNYNYTKHRVGGTNPCVTGDTKILVADGRGHVTFRRLVKENRDVPVFSVGRTPTGEPRIEVKMMRRPRVSGYNQPVYRVTLDDGSSVRCTGNHKFMLLDGGEKEARDLMTGDRLLHATRFMANMREITGSKNCNSSDYYWFNISGVKQPALVAQKRLGEARHLTDLPLEIADSGRLMVRKVCNSCGVEFSIPFGRREQCYCSVSCSRVHANTTGLMRGATKKSKDEVARKRMGKLRDKIDFPMFINEDGNLRVKKSCEWCGTEFSVQPSRMSKKLCCVSCSVSYHNSNKRKEVIGENYKVVSVEMVGYEDVYNGTVEDNHNYLVMTSEGKTESGKKLYNYVPVLNCGEIPLPLSYGACCLGSLNLMKYVDHKNKDFDYETFKQDVCLATAFLDGVLSYAIENKKYPLEDNISVAKELRLIGLGVTGLADCLFLMGHKYDSKEVLEIVEKIMRTKEEWSYITSMKLGELLGSYELFDADKASDTGHFKKVLERSKLVKEEFDRTQSLRNAQVGTVAPSGSLSILMGCSSGIEPVFDTHYTRMVKLDGKESQVSVIHPLVHDLILIGKLPEEKSKAADHIVTAHRVDSRMRVQIQAVCQKYTDGSISSTVNLPESATVEDIKEIYEMACEYGCKGITIFRDGSKEGVMKSEEPRDDMDNGILEGKTIRIPYESKWYVTLNSVNGRPVELFINAGKSGSDVKSWTEATGRLISMYLQEGGDAARVIKTLKDIRGKDTVIRNGMILHSGPDAVSKALEKLCNQRVGPRYSRCSSCNELTYVTEGGCGHCMNPSCSFSNCE